MKTETVQTLITARTLFDKAHELCVAEDKHTASAGLVILQDAIELVLCSCIIELEIDVNKNIDRLTFRDLIKELRGADRKVIKGRDLEALHNERINVKHYGHLAEPTTVRNFFNSAKVSMDDLLKQVVGKALQEIMLHEVIKKGEAKDFVQRACVELEKDNFFDVLINIRKAIYVEIEEEYSIEGWKDASTLKNPRARHLSAGGLKAPWFTKNEEWIDENVNTPFDYIQLDPDTVQLDLMEWGVSTQDFWNLRKLTPKVFRYKKTQKWIVEKEPKHLIEGATKENAKYCIDRAISIIAKKQRHKELSRFLEDSPIEMFNVKVKCETPLYEKASENSKTQQNLQAGTIWNGDRVIEGGLDEETSFVKIFHFDDSNKSFLSGYVVSSDCEILKPD